MSSLAPEVQSMPAPLERPKHHYLNHNKSIISWLCTLDHKRIGLLYMVMVLAAFAIGGFFAIVLRTELWGPAPLFNADKTKAWTFYNHSFTIHGAVMVFMFIIPAIPAILGNFALPIMLGAKDVAFPRLNLASFYIYVLGGLFFLYVLLGGTLSAFFGINLPGGFGLDTGWTFYTPYSTTASESGVLVATLGAFILGFSSILTGLNFIATVHMLRPKGMTWFRIPLFVWAIYATGLIQVLATPVLAITLLLLVAEKALQVGIFDPNMGGDPVLYQHFFWFYSHPAVYIMILPAFGIISELITVHSRRHIFGYHFIALSSVAIALLGFLVWGHHMFTSGQSSLGSAIFSLITFSIAIPSAVKVFNWVATLWGASIHLRTPMLYALFFIGLFTIGGLTGLHLGTISTDIHLHDTYFVVAHFHYVMVGSMLFAFIGGMYHWFPKMFGKMYNERVGQFGAIVTFIGFNMTFLIQFVAGAEGMPRRYASYPEGFQIYHQISTIGAYIISVGMIVTLYNWVAGLLWGPVAPANPWGGNTLEWQTASPPPHDNFATAPEVGDPYEMQVWDPDPNGHGWVKNPEKAAAAAAASHGH